MRIAGTSYTDSIVNQLNLLAAQQYQLQNQVSTGQRIQSPADDPAAMSAALNLQTESSNVEQFSQNISTLQNRATLSGNALQQLKTISDQANEIATGVGGATSTQTLQADAAQVTQLIQQAVDVLNAKDGNQYLFGGTASGQPPYSVTTDAGGNVTGVTYQGNASVSQSQISANSTVSVNVPGENNTGSGPRGVVSDSRYGADLFNHLISLQNNLLNGDTNAVTTTDLPALTNDENNIIYQVADNGAVQTRLDTAASAATASQTALQQSITNVAGADLTQTLVQLTQANNSYQAGLQSASAILQLQQSLLACLP
jgi:flagellar hook-associated protein 3 FlgL